MKRHCYVRIFGCLLSCRTSQARGEGWGEGPNETICQSEGQRGSTKRPEPELKKGQVHRCKPSRKRKSVQQSREEEEVKATGQRQTDLRQSRSGSRSVSRSSRSRSRSRSKSESRSRSRSEQGMDKRVMESSPTPEDEMSECRSVVVVERCTRAVELPCVYVYVDVYVYLYVYVFCGD